MVISNPRSSLQLSHQFCFSFAVSSFKWPPMISVSSYSNPCTATSSTILWVGYATNTKKVMLCHHETVMERLRLPSWSLSPTPLDHLLGRGPCSAKSPPNNPVSSKAAPLAQSSFLHCKLMRSPEAE